MMTKPVFSPMALRAFLLMRAAYLADCRHAGVTACKQCRQRYLKTLQITAEVTPRDMDKAVTGQLMAAGPRERLWRALGCVPADQGIELVNRGGQKAVAS